MITITAHTNCLRTFRGFGFSAAASSLPASASEHGFEEGLLGAPPKRFFFLKRPPNPDLGVTAAGACSAVGVAAASASFPLSSSFSLGRVASQSSLATTSRGSYRLRMWQRPSASNSSLSTRHIEAISFLIN